MKREILHSSKWFFAFFTLLVLFISCRKNEVADPGKELSREELQKTFFNTSTTNDAEIKKLAENIQKQQLFLKSLPEFIRKNGIPKWDKVLYKTKGESGGQQPVKTSSTSLKTNTVSNNGANQGVFFIPLQDENSKQIKSYITAYKHNDSLYTYRLYNKDSLNAIRPGSNITKSNLLNTQAVFGYFEKTINNTDSVNVLSPTKATLKNVKINFDTPTNTNSVTGAGVKPMSGDGCLVAMSVSIEYTLIIWSDGSYSESVSVTMIIAFDCSGGGGGGSGGFGDGSTTYQSPDSGTYWWSYGTGWPYNTGGGGYINNDPNYNHAGGGGNFDPNWYWWWNNNPGQTLLQNFANTLSSTEFNFWNDPSNFVIVNTLTDRLNQENYSAEVQDFVKWAIDYLIANPSVTNDVFINEFLTPSEGTDGPYGFNQSYWDDPNLVIPTQTLPSYQDFYNNFPNVDADAVYNLIGGPILAHHQSDPVNYSNACALRVSRALNYAGKTIPAVNGTEQGADGKNYFLSAKALNAYLRKAFGPPTDHFTQTQGGRNGENFPNLIAGKKGIYSMIASGWVASGHADLFTGTICKRGCDITKFTTTIDIWELQ
ncbi:T6SS effector amidase Tae4 family protein [uncultured Mucilaginibacter sp.]|uniref:T6SS effector amidase Tae4 family protein n=1 Tax=uncultured Mucilaginibacter sp. TaxID=797541 RepID=UPI002629A04E|nr:T6SS effector amidase Tae4 family protein [uncultured Mucilaginibacter sp.]